MPEDGRDDAVARQLLALCQEMEELRLGLKRAGEKLAETASAVGKPTPRIDAALAYAAEMLAITEKAVWRAQARLRAATESKPGQPPDDSTDAAAGDAEERT